MTNFLSFRVLMIYALILTLSPALMGQDEWTLCDGEQRSVGLSKLGYYIQYRTFLNLEKILPTCPESEDGKIILHDIRIDYRVHEAEVFFKLFLGRPAPRINLSRAYFALKRIETIHETTTIEAFTYDKGVTQFPLVFEGLPSGEYEIDLISTDDPDLDDVYPRAFIIYLEGPDEPFTLFSIENESCPDAMDGQINVLPIHPADPPHSVAWEDGVESLSRTNLSTGVYNGTYKYPIDDRVCCRDIQVGVGVNDCPTVLYQCDFETEVCPEAYCTGGCRVENGSLIADLNNTELVYLIRPEYPPGNGQVLYFEIDWTNLPNFASNEHSYIAVNLHWP
ncbi:MAG: hypothetical protein R3275_13375, partial [Saprospiraceae bacterium]|nr:hypothetical protein [Saprospiraceae bacterium]